MESNTSCAQAETRFVELNRAVGLGSAVAPNQGLQNDGCVPKIFHPLLRALREFILENRTPQVSLYHAACGGLSRLWSSLGS